MSANKKGVQGIAVSSGVTWGQLLTQADNGTYITAQYKDPREDWDEARWVEYFQTAEKYPEAVKALATINSKLYRSLK